MLKNILFAVTALILVAVSAIYFWQKPPEEIKGPLGSKSNPVAIPDFGPFEVIDGRISNTPSRLNLIWAHFQQRKNCTFPAAFTPDYSRGVGVEPVQRVVSWKRIPA